MLVKELIQKLQGLNPEAPIRLSVRWAGDTAIANEIDIVGPDPMEPDHVQLSGWLYGCNTELEIQETDDDAENPPG